MVAVDSSYQPDLDSYPHWKRKEFIVSVLEKYISPDSDVRHNQFLPVIGRSNRRPRQCDVVIVSGIAPRQFITIVEVQDRGSVVGINDLHAWVRKMEEVGANQLICVSSTGYSSSVVEDVKSVYGDRRICLMTLQEFDYLNNPQRLNMVPALMNIRRKELTIEDIGRAKLVGHPNENHVVDYSFTLSDRIFSYLSYPDEVTLVDIIESQLKDNMEYASALFESGSIKVPIKVTKESNLFVRINDKKYHIYEWEFVALYTLEKEWLEMGVSQFVYRQEIINDAIAWFAAATFQLNGYEHTIEIVTKTDSGQICVSCRAFKRKLV